MSLKNMLLRTIGSTSIRVLQFVDIVKISIKKFPGKEQNLKNPYTWYKVLRETSPVLRTYANRGWLILGFEQVQAAFTDPRFSSDLRGNKFIEQVLRAAADGQKIQLLDDPSMLNLDAPDHTRLRKLVSHGFLRKYILSLEPSIKNIVQNCLSGIAPSANRFDLMANLAKPLPAIVIAELMGLPQEDKDKFQQWSNELINLSKIDDPVMVERGNIANNLLLVYFAEIIEKKRQSPSQDLIGQLIAAEEEGDRLTAGEMHSTCVLLLLAGHETTTRLIGNGMYTLLQHPDQLALLQRDPTLIPNAIEEMLRYEPPVQTMPRFAKEDLEFFGAKIKKDQLLLLSIASANRDEAKIIDAEKFDVTRENPTHVSFGYGIHLCLGLALARLEAKVAIEMLIEEFPDLHLADQDVDWQGGGLVRGMEHLWLEKDKLTLSAAIGSDL